MQTARKKPKSQKWHWIKLLHQALNSRSQGGQAAKSRKALQKTKSGKAAKVQQKARKVEPTHPKMCKIQSHRRRRKLNKSGQFHPDSSQKHLCLGMLWMPIGCLDETRHGGNLSKNCHLVAPRPENWLKCRCLVKLLVLSEPKSPKGTIYGFLKPRKIKHAHGLIYVRYFEDAQNHTKSLEFGAQGFLVGACGYGNSQNSLDTGAKIRRCTKIRMASLVLGALRIPNH